MKIKFMPLGNLGANFYMLIDEKSNEMLIADPGDCADVILDLIRESGAELKYIVLTHAHTDHIGALDKIKEIYDAPVVIHKYDKDALNDGRINLCTAFGKQPPVTKADIAAEDGDIVSLGEYDVRFIHTPGHTRGSMCILCNDVLLTGDTLFRLSIGRTDFPGGSFEEISDSVRTKIYTLPPNITVYPGHGDATTVEYERNNNPYVKDADYEADTYKSQ